MTPKLRKSHQANDKAVMQAYGFCGEINSESECVAELNICMMANVLGIDSNKYAIIPSVGASNCVNICSILHG